MKNSTTSSHETTRRKKKKKEQRARQNLVQAVARNRAYPKTLESINRFQNGAKISRHRGETWGKNRDRLKSHKETEGESNSWSVHRSRGFFFGAGMFLHAGTKWERERSYCGLVKFFLSFFFFSFLFHFVSSFFFLYFCFIFIVFFFFSFDWMSKKGSEEEGWKG